MQGRVFSKLFLLFSMVLVTAVAVLSIALHSMARRSPSPEVFRLTHSGLAVASFTAMAVAGIVAALLAAHIARRMSRIMTFANRIADGDLTARVQEAPLDEMSEVVAALDRTAARLEGAFSQIESSRRDLATVLDSMQEAIVAVTPQGTVTWSNAAMQNIAGVQVRVGRGLVESIRDPDILASVDRALTEQQPSQGRATTLSPGRIFEINSSPMAGGGAVTVLHDVTQLEAAERASRDFLANVSHELRTPLTSISGYVETLLEDPVLREQSAEEFLGIILKNATRMNRLTSDLLALAHIESRNYQPRRTSIAANELMTDAFESLSGMVMDSEVQLVEISGTEIPVFADADAFMQIFGNLVENAMKYGRGGKKIEVGALAPGESSSAGNNPEAGFVRFFVRDYGPGIPFEHLDRIFERFYRVDKARSRDSGGTGLGLAIVWQMIAAHGGRVWVESELGSGATFFFTLPIADQQDVEPS